MVVAKPLIFLVPELGIEPRRGCPRGILSPVRLPVSPLRHLKKTENRKNFLLQVLCKFKMTINYFAFENKTISNHHEKK